MPMGWACRQVPAAMPMGCGQAWASMGYGQASFAMGWELEEPVAYVAMSALEEPAADVSMLALAEGPAL